ncbi:HNH endonuclease [bacterium]|nr:HNH endonuclease [bacterium]
MNQNRLRENNSNWKGGRYVNAGRPMILNYNHPRSHVNGYVLEHILLAEKALGKSLPPKTDVHHADANTENNSNSNLVIWEGRSYHALLHRRTNALIACDHANWRKCLYCKEWDEPQNMYVNARYAYHRNCKNEDQKNRYHK